MPKTITIPGQEIFIPPDRIMNTQAVTIKIEHSLVAIAKWEAKWHVPFLDPNTEKTNEMMIDYIRCMTISQNVDPSVYNYMPADVIKEINDYIDDPMTATWFADTREKGGREIITNELIYYWMIAQNIPMECAKWHFNHLMTLIRVCSEKNAPQKKMSRREIYSQNKALNAARRKAMNSKG